MVNFTRALAGEWGVYGINVNALGAGLLPEQDDARRLLERIGVDKHGAATRRCAASATTTT